MSARAPRPDLPPPRLARSPLTRALLLVLGTLALGLGALGVFIRGLPTVPFLLLAAWCYGRSSARLYRWIYGHRVFGPILVAWETERSLSVRTKTLGIASVWIGMFASVTAFHFIAAARLFPWLAVLMLLVAVGVTLFLTTRRTSVPPDTAPGLAILARKDAEVRARRFGVQALVFGTLAAALHVRFILRADSDLLIAGLLVIGMGAALVVQRWRGREARASPRRVGETPTTAEDVA